MSGKVGGCAHSFRVKVACEKLKEIEYRNTTSLKYLHWMSD